MFPSYRNQLTGFYMMGILTVKGLTLTFRTVKNLCPDLQKPPFKIPGYAPGFETFSHSQEHEKIFMQENCIPSSENLLIPNWCIDINSPSAKAKENTKQKESIVK